MITHPIGLADAAALGARAGAKAANLARLIGAGLPVPDGFALGHGAFAAVVGDLADLGAIALDEVGHRFGAAEVAVTDAALPAALDHDVRARAAALGQLAVRSSMALEDGGAGAGAGVFVSAVDVAPAAVWDAIRAVWLGAFSPLAAAYARHRAAAAPGVGVIVQRFVAGPRITIYTRPPGAPHDAHAWVERAGAARTIVPRTSDAPMIALALAAERAIGATGGADVELIEGAAGLVIVQARPIVHPTARPPRRPAPLALFGFTRATPDLTWRWDAAHNPAPLSPAQAGLVARVEAAGAATSALQVVAGYLYYAELGSAVPAAPSSAAALTAAVEAGLAHAAAHLGPAPSVAAAIDAYVAWYRIWAREVSAVISAARRALVAALRAEVGDAAHQAFAALAAGGAAHAGLTAALADDSSGSRTSALATFGAWAPAWDVAVPTLAERPGWLDAAQAARRGRRAPPAAAAIDPTPRAALAAAILALAERDDLAFAAAQAVVRRALLAAGAGLDDPDDVFWLPLDEVAAAPALDPISARSRAAGARAAARRALAWDMPLAVRDGAAVEVAHGGLRGLGAGPRVVGPAVLVDELATLATDPPRPGAVLIVPAVTPALALFAQGALAIVAEHGGALDHGAALARELGIPYVAGCHGARAAITPGALVIVDGDAGTVELA
jgi:pyruvate,water dikinase